MAEFVMRPFFFFNTNSRSLAPGGFVGLVMEGIEEGECVEEGNRGKE